MAYFTPGGQRVSFPGRIGLYSQEAYGQGAGQRDDRFLVANKQKGAYSYYGPGYSGHLLDYDPQGREVTIEGRTYNPRESTSALGQGTLPPPVATPSWAPPPSVDTHIRGNAPSLGTYAPREAPTYDYSASEFNMPELNMPEMNKKRMQFLSQQAAAPGLRSARGQMQGLGAQSYSSPMEKAKVMRQAFKGLGQTYSDILGRSREQARNEYLGLEFNPLLQKTFAEHGAKVDKQKMLHGEEAAGKIKKFEASWNTWKAETDAAAKAMEAENQRKMDIYRMDWSSGMDKWKVGVGRDLDVWKAGEARKYDVWKTNVAARQAALDRAAEMEKTRYVADANRRKQTMYI